MRLGRSVVVGVETIIVDVVVIKHLFDALRVELLQACRYKLLIIELR